MGGPHRQTARATPSLTVLIARTPRVGPPHPPTSRDDGPSFPHITRLPDPPPRAEPRTSAAANGHGFRRPASASEVHRAIHHRAGPAGDAPSQKAPGARKLGSDEIQGFINARTKLAGVSRAQLAVPRRTGNGDLGNGSTPATRGRRPPRSGTTRRLRTRPVPSSRNKVLGGLSFLRAARNGQSLHGYDAGDARPDLLRDGCPAIGPRRPPRAQVP